MLEQGRLTVNVGVISAEKYKNKAAPATFAAGAERGICQLNPSPQFPMPGRGRKRLRSWPMLLG